MGRNTQVAVILSIVETCRRMGIPVREYFRPPDLGEIKLIRV